MTVPSLPSIAALTVVDRGLGFGALLAADHFGVLGATVLRAPPPGGDPFDEIHPAYRSIRSSQHLLAEGTPALEAALEQADICIVGGEDFPGGVQADAPEALLARFPRLVVLELSGGVDAAGQPQPAVDILAQARSGLCFDQLAGQPFAWPFPAPTYAMALNGLIGAWAALIARERTGVGQIVRVSLQEGAAAVAAPDRLRYERPTPEAQFRVPRDVRQLILRCADGRYVQFAKPPGSLARVYDVLGIPVTGDPATFEARERALATDPRDFFGRYDAFAEKARSWRSGDLLAALWQAGIPADAVLAPGEVWEDPQVAANASIVTRPDGGRTPRMPIRLRRFTDEADGVPRSMAADGAGPLGGIKVVGLGAYIAGPYSGRVLADLGADVIKVDAPGGDPSAGTYGHWWVCNSGKRSIRINVKTAEGRDCLHRLCADADVVHHNFRPGVAERLGVDPAALRSHGKPIVTLQCSAYGTTGPKADYPGFGLTGNEVRAGGEGQAPLWYRQCIADYSAGMLGGIAVLAGLYERGRSGASVEADVNLLDTALYMMSELVRRPDGGFEGAPLNGPERLGASDDERLYRAADGWLAVAARGDAMRARLRAVLGLEASAGAAELAHAFASLPVDAALTRLAEGEVWAARCVDLWDRALDADPAAVAAGLVRRFEDPVMGEVVGTGALVRLSAEPAIRPGRAPRIGEHTREIALDAGYDAEAADDLIRRGIIA